MKTLRILALALCCVQARADTTVDPAEPYAYAANAGWINAYADGTNGAVIGQTFCSGYLYGANIGWISLSGVRTAVLRAGADSDGDGIPDPWELQMTGVLTVLSGGSHDADDDGVCDASEYGAVTAPLDDQSLLTFTAFSRSGTTDSLTWTVRPTRFYALWQAPAVSNGAAWAQNALGVISPDAGPAMTRTVNTASSAQFYRVQTVLPLSE